MLDLSAMYKYTSALVLQELILLKSVMTDDESKLYTFISKIANQQADTHKLVHKGNKKIKKKNVCNTQSYTMYTIRQVVQCMQHTKSYNACYI